MFWYFNGKNGILKRISFLMELHFYMEIKYKFFVNGKLIKDKYFYLF